MGWGGGGGGSHMVERLDLMIGQELWSLQRCTEPCSLSGCCIYSIICSRILLRIELLYVSELESKVDYKATSMSTVRSSAAPVRAHAVCLLTGKLPHAGSSRPRPTLTS